MPYLFREKGIIDEIHLWVNTTIKSDLDYIFDLAAKHPGLIRTIFPTKNLSQIFYKVSHFYKFCTEPRTIYVKCDDDIVFIEKNTIEEFAKFRIENPNPFLVYPNIINNAIFSAIHQKMDCFSTEIGICKYSPWSSVGLKSSLAASLIHETFHKKYFNNQLDDYKFKKWIFHEYERVSINFVAFTGFDIKHYNREDKDDEATISSELPDLLKRPCLAFGQKLVCHFSYGPQRPIENELKLLEIYKEIMKKETNG